MTIDPTRHAEAKAKAKAECNRAEHDEPTGRPAKCRVQYQDDPTLGGLLESEVDELRSTFQGPAAMMRGLKLLQCGMDA